MNTIVALATPAGNSGVAVIRISGEDSLSILRRLIREDLSPEPRKMYLKNVFVKDFVDRSLVVFFASPYSYTGEDVVEIQSHGGYFLAQAIIEEVLSLGARLADHGEFSKRAFVNGKISLDQAEGIIDLINAESELQAKTSSDQMMGELRQLITNYQNEITEILADIEAKLDYPEYDYSIEESASVKNRLLALQNNLLDLINNSKQGLIIKNGIKVAIVGSPNVGKSSLLNALTKSNKAIVTNVAGTTRDVIEAEYIYKNIIFRLFDTAGIHESTDVVEKIGIDRALKAINDADIVLKVSTPESYCDIEISKPYIDVYNKSDLVDDITDNKYIYVSALTGNNIGELKQLIFDKTVTGDLRSDQLYLTNTRHIDCVRLASDSISRAIKIFDFTTFDIISSEIKSAWRFLGEISSVVSDEAIIDKIFSKFCLGK